MIKLNAREKENSKGFIADLFFAAGVLSKSLRSASLRRAFHNASSSAAAKTVTDEIIYKTFKFFDVDKALEDLAQYPFIANPRKNNGPSIQRSKEVLAAYLANFCAERKIYWDDVTTNRTTYEMDQYKQSVFGGALWDYECFVSQQVARLSNPAKPSRTSAPRTPGQPPKNNYKSSGAQSGKARALIGTPGQKEMLTAAVMYKIIDAGAKTSGGKELRAYIKPLEARGDAGGTNKVFVGSSTGYTDMTCCFDDLQKANAFAAALANKANNPNLKVVKMSLDKNGYYGIGTECGDCYVAAVKLNEQAKDKTYPDIIDIDVYNEAFMRE